MNNVMREIKTLINHAIGMKEEELKENMNLDDSDLLTSLLQVKDEYTGERIPKKLIIDESLTFLFAGHGNYKILNKSL